MRRQNINRKIKPSVASHFPSLSNGRDMNSNVYMFTEDIHLGIMPIGGRTTKQENFMVEFQGEDLDCEKAKNIIGELGEFDKYDNGEMVCDAVENIARNLSWAGRAVYEIIRDDEQIYLHGFTSKNLMKVVFWYFQIIPPQDRKLWEKKYICINSDKIWTIGMPSELGGTRGYKRLLKRLRRFNHFGPIFFRKDMELGITSKHYDFNMYVINSEINYNRVTKKWGWNRRDWTQEKCTEFYTFYKMLSFRYAQAILREHIIKEINRLLKRLSIKCELAVHGLPTSEKIMQLRNDLQKGTISFAEASDEVTL